MINEMKKPTNILKISVLVLLFVSLLCLSSCGTQNTGEMDGRWAHIYEKDKCALSFSGDTVKLDGVKYKYAVEDNTLLLTKDGKTDRMRFVMNGDGSEMNIYKKTEYVFEGEGTPDGLIGKWVNEENKWSFEFTENGMFNEDGFFPGYYSLDDENSSFKLMYVDHFEDSVCYYSISGNVLTVEYPWQMVKMQ